MFGRFARALSGATTKFGDKPEVLEGACAAAALVAGKDGSVDDAEVSAMLAAIKANAMLGGAFSEAQIAAAAEKQLARIKQGYTGKAALNQEIADVAALNDPEASKAVVLVALDVAAGDGDIAAGERQVLDGIARKLGIDLNRLMGE